MGFLLANPLRRIGQNPHRLLTPFVRERMTVLEPGPGMGFFTLEMAWLVGPQGKVVAVDIQPRMLEGLRRRARRAGLDGRINARLASQNGLGVDDLRGAVDFILAFAVVHELPDAEAFFRDAYAVLKSGSKLLLAEPPGPVTGEEFALTVSRAENAGLHVIDRPVIGSSHAAVLARP